MQKFSKTLADFFRITNLKHWSSHEKLVDDTLTLLNDLSVGYTSVRKLIRLPEIQFLMNNHTVSFYTIYCLSTISAFVFWIAWKRGCSCTSREQYLCMLHFFVYSVAFPRPAWNSQTFWEEELVQCWLIDLMLTWLHLLAKCKDHFVSVGQSCGKLRRNFLPEDLPAAVSCWPMKCHRESENIYRVFQFEMTPEKMP